MQERTALEDQLTAIGRIEQELDDKHQLIELGEAEKDQAVVTDAENALRRLKADVARRETRGAAVRRGRSQRQLSGSPCRRRRHREPGLGQHAAAHVHALGREARLQGRVHGGDARARRPASSRRPSRSRAATPMAGSRPRGGVHRLVRISPYQFQCAPPHLVREHRGLSGDRRQHQDRHPGGRTSASTACARAGQGASTSTRPSRRSA